MGSEIYEVDAMYEDEAGVDWKVLISYTLSRGADHHDGVSSVHFIGARFFASGREVPYLPMTPEALDTWAETWLRSDYGFDKAVDAATDAYYGGR